MFLANIRNDAARPSFFEMIAQQEMMPTLKPAIRYVLETLSLRHPRLERITRFTDEIFAGLLFLLESHHLKHYDGSFSESFYGLKRVRVQKTSLHHDVSTSSSTPSTPTPSISSKPDITTSPITNRNRYLALFFLVIVPYIKSKLDELYREKVPYYNFNILDRSRDDTEPPPTTRIGKLKRLLLKIFTITYPWLNAFYEGSFFVYQLLYLYDHTMFYTPFLHLEGVILQRLTNEEMEQQTFVNEKRRRERLANLRGGPIPQMWKLTVHLYDLVLDYSKLLLPLSIFSFRFLEWWYTENRLNQSTSLPIPPPPEPCKPAADGVALPADKTLCPLCNKPRTNVAMSVGGYVFCYPCLFGFVEQNHKCPVTHLPMEPDYIRKIYTSV